MTLNTKNSVQDKIRLQEEIFNYLKNNLTVEVVEREIEYSKETYHKVIVMLKNPITNNLEIIS